MDRFRFSAWRCRRPRLGSGTGAVLVGCCTLASTPCLYGQARGSASLTVYSFGEVAAVGDVWASHSWDTRRQQATGAAMLRLGTDGLTRADISELSWQLRRTPVEVEAGLRTFSWGVGESRSPADMVNQMDHASEVPTRLGQLHAGLGLTGSWGRIAGWILPWFRESPLAGTLNHPWATGDVEASSAVFTPDAAQKHPAWVLRWDRQVGAMDLALWHFHGTARDPRFVADSTVSSEPLLVPQYQHAVLTGAQMRWATGAWVWRLDGVIRQESGTSVDAIAGTEVALASFLFLTTEMAYDGRGSDATTSLEHDVFVGARLVFQDGWIALQGGVDWRTANTLLAVQASRRFGDQLTVALTAGAHLGDPAQEPSNARRRDERASLGVAWYF